MTLIQKFNPFKRNCTGIKLSCILLLLVTIQVKAKVTLPSLFSNNMILQQKTNAAIWGKADAGKTITISTTWSSKRYTSKADAAGNWKIKVATPSYGGPYQISISDGTPTLLSNVMIGEVWVCSGQSNMEMTVAGWGKIDNYEKEVAAANYPDIRLFQVTKAISNSPLADAKADGGGWNPCSPASVAEFSAVAYFFAREVYKKTGVPIGLIHTSWGGTIIEAWTSAGTLQQIPGFAETIKKISNPGNVSDYNQELKLWESILSDNDAGNGKGKPGWASKDLNDTSWKNITVPGFWEQTVLPEFDGIVYFRKHLDLPKSWEGKSLTINLGLIDDDDVAFFNGEKIGETQGTGKLRVYTVPAEQIKAGNNVITVRVSDGGGDGGFYSNKGVISATSANGESISLDGAWKYQVGLNLKDIPAKPAPDNSPNKPTVLFNAMINPFTPFAVRGAIWYQGESNADRAGQYRSLFPAMIKDWRAKWKQGDFPFYFVQLANFKKTEAEPATSSWAELRDAQRETLSIPNTGMAVAIDIGNAEDVHPKNKQEVGRRLALIALAKTYGQQIAYSGPSFTSQKIERNQIRLSFKNTDGGLMAKADYRLKGFAVAGADQKFYWAEAKIEGDQVIVTCPKVLKPVAVRYAWGNNPICNLYNEAGLPASPFRTDKW